MMLARAPVLAARPAGAKAPLAIAPRRVAVIRRAAKEDPPAFDAEELKLKATQFAEDATAALKVRPGGVGGYSGIDAGRRAGARGPPGRECDPLTPRCANRRAPRQLLSRAPTALHALPTWHSPPQEKWEKTEDKPGGGCRRAGGGEGPAA